MLKFELPQFGQMPAAAVPKDVCYQAAPRVQEQANRGTEPCMGLVLYHFYAAPEAVTRFGICMEQILQKQCENMLHVRAHTWRSALLRMELLKCIQVEQNTSIIISSFRTFSPSWVILIITHHNNNNKLWMYAPTERIFHSHTEDSTLIAKQMCVHHSVDNCGDEDSVNRYFLLEVSQNCSTYLEYLVEEFLEIWGRKLLLMKLLHLNQQCKQF